MSPGIDPWITYIGNASDAGTLELKTIELLDCSGEVGSALKLDKAFLWLVLRRCSL